MFANLPSLRATGLIVLYSLLIFGFQFPGIQALAVGALLPFLPLAWIGGMLGVQLTGSEQTYLPAAWLVILLQIYLCAWHWKHKRAVQLRRSYEIG